MIANTEAPTKLSAAIHMALEDQLAVEKDPLVEINMGSWHDPQGEFYKCSVCFAGAVMHQRFELGPNDKAEPDYFAEDWFRVFKALDAVRRGGVGMALRYINPYGDIKCWVDACKISMTRPFPKYSENREKFREEMRSIAKQLEEMGL